MLLEFANIPPTSRNDIELSESGESLLRDARHRDHEEVRLDTLGRVAFRELVDSFEGTKDSEVFADSMFEALVDSPALERVHEVLESDASVRAFVYGLIGGQVAYDQGQRIAVA